MIMHILPLLVFTTFSGLAAGVAVFRAIVPTKSIDGKLAWMMPAISIILLARFVAPSPILASHCASSTVFPTPAR